MMHDRPAQRESDKRWDYVTGNRRTGTYPIGYCRKYREWTREDLYYRNEEYAMKEVEKLNAEYAPFKDKFHEDGHATREEACECYKQYMLNHNLKFYDERTLTEEQKAKRHSRNMRRCQVDGCGEWTESLADFGGMSQHFDLCVNHLNREEVEKLYSVGESWHS